MNYCCRVVAPDLEATLKPIIEKESSGKWSERIMDGKLSVGEFKQAISKKWRRREGMRRERFWRVLRIGRFWPL
jgi:hypothetical protein